MEPILLSIVIPTKNRAFTAFYAVKSALMIGARDIEVIVQDCSDTDELCNRLVSLEDDRIKYVFDPEKVSMTENWNRAYERAKGEYVIGIGDDDSVFVEVYDAAVWARKNNAEALLHTEPYQYFWPNFPHKHIQKRLLFKPFTGKAHKINDLMGAVTAKAKFCDDGYGQGLPMVYHRLISKKLLLRLKEKTGKILDGTSLDVYSAYALGLIGGDMYSVDYPLSMRGASLASNTGRFSIKKDKEHFDEYKFLDYPDWLPKISVVHVTIAESIHKAFVNTGNEHLENIISLEYLYARCLVDRPNEYKRIFGLAKRYFTSADQWLLATKYWLRFTWKAIDFSLRKTLEKNPILAGPLFVYRKIIGKKFLFFDDILAVDSYHRDFVKANNISLQFDLIK